MIWKQARAGSKPEDELSAAVGGSRHQGGGERDSFS